MYLGKLGAGYLRLTLDHPVITMSFKNQNIIEASMAALSGLVELSQETSAKRELGVLIFSLGVFVYIQDIYSFLLVLISFLMLSAEAMNSAIETLCDEVNETYRPRIKRVKDLGAAAVVILIVAYGVTLCIVALKFFEIFTIH